MCCNSRCVYQVDAVVHPGEKKGHIFNKQEQCERNCDVVPGVSIRLMQHCFQLNVTAAELIVMPRSLSCSM